MMPCLPFAFASNLADKVCNTPIDGSPGVAVPKKARVGYWAHGPSTSPDHMLGRRTSSFIMVAAAVSVVPCPQQYLQRFVGSTVEESASGGQKAARVRRVSGMASTLYDGISMTLIEAHSKLSGQPLESAKNANSLAMDAGTTGSWLHMLAARVFCSSVSTAFSAGAWRSSALSTRRL